MYDVRVPCRLFAVAGVGTRAPPRRSRSRGATGSARALHSSRPARRAVRRAHGNGSGGAVWYPMGAAVSPAAGRHFLPTGSRAPKIYLVSGRAVRVPWRWRRRRIGAVRTRTALAALERGPARITEAVGIAVDETSRITSWSATTRTTASRSSRRRERPRTHLRLGCARPSPRRRARRLGERVRRRLRQQPHRGVHAGRDLVRGSAPRHGSRATGRGPGAVGGAGRIGVGPSGNVIVSDRADHRVDEFSPTGSFIRRSVTGSAPARPRWRSAPRAACRPQPAAARPARDPRWSRGRRRWRPPRLRQRQRTHQPVHRDGELPGILRQRRERRGETRRPRGARDGRRGQRDRRRMYNHRVDVFDYRLPTVALDQPSLAFGAGRPARRARR